MNYYFKTMILISESYISLSPFFLKEIHRHSPKSFSLVHLFCRWFSGDSLSLLVWRKLLLARLTVAALLWQSACIKGQSSWPGWLFSLFVWDEKKREGKEMEKDSRKHMIPMPSFTSFWPINTCFLCDIQNIWNKWWNALSRGM